MRTLFFCLILFTCASAVAATEVSSKAIDLNRQGSELLKKQNFTAAEDKFASGLAASPFASELQVNLGLAFDGAGNIEKAKQAYQLAAKNSQDPETRFVANFNLGELAGREKKVDEALNYYQQALNDKPDSLEAKTNIELLVQSQKDQNGKNDKQSKDGKDNKDKKDKKDQDKQDKDNKENKDKDKKDQDKDKKDDQGDKDKDKNKDQEKQGYEKNKPQPKPFKSDQLSPGDVKRIMEELDRQEQRVRAEYNKKQIKETPRDKDW